MADQATETGKTVIAVNAEVADKIAKDVLPPEDTKDIKSDTTASSNEKDSQVSTPAGETKVTEQPANSGAKDSTEADVGLSDDEFALANVARSLGTCLLKGDSTELRSKLFNDILTDNEQRHGHRIVVQKDGTTIRGHTYEFKGEGTDHSHVIEFELGTDGVVSGKTRSANTGPDHQHQFKIERNDWPWSVPDHETLTKLVEKLEKLEQDGKLPESQTKLLASKQFCGPNRSFPCTDKAHVQAALSLLPRFKGNTDVQSRIMSSVSKRLVELAIDIDQNVKKVEIAKETTVPAISAPAPSDQNTKVAELEGEIKALKAQLSDKTEEVKGLTDASARLHKSLNTSLAQQLVVVKWVLDKEDSRKVKDESALNELVAKLSQRSADSLRDSIEDLIPELDIYLRDHRGGINKRILSTTKQKITEDVSAKQVVKAADQTNQQKKSSVVRSKPVEKPAAEQLSKDLTL